MTMRIFIPFCLPLLALGGCGDGPVSVGREVQALHVCRDVLVVDTSIVDAGEPDMRAILERGVEIDWMIDEGVPTVVDTIIIQTWTWTCGPHRTWHP